MSRHDGVKRYVECWKRTGMNNAIVLNADDIKKLIAEKYGVSEKNVIKSQYSYTVILDGKTEDK